MELLLRLLIVLIGCLVAIVLPATPAQGACGTPFIRLSSDSGVPGTQVAVEGQRFQAGTYVDIYYDGTSIAVGSTDLVGNFAVTITIPEGCKGGHQVHAQVLPDTADAYFTVKPGLTVSPEKGLPGTNVTVKGRGFAKNEQGIELRYYFNGNYQTIVRNITADAGGSWKTSFPIPPSAGGDHKLDAQGVETRLTDVEEATFQVATEISIDKSSGIVGDTIVMTGSRFVAYESGIQILFADQPVVTGIKASAQGDWEGSFNVPEMRTGTFSITAEGQQTKREDISDLNFKIEPGIALSSYAGYVGMNVTATGRGFAASKDVVMRYEGSQAATATTNTTGSFVASFSVPESQHGEHRVTAEDTAKNKATATLTVESDPPPMPTLISPSNGSREGLVGTVRPTFEWSEVSEDSGVR
jgi:hypothetical protein